MTWCTATGFFHTWGQWETYPAELRLRSKADALTGAEVVYDPPLSVSQLWEKRRCTLCGHEQHQQIRNF